MIIGNSLTGQTFGRSGGVDRNSENKSGARAGALPSNNNALPPETTSASKAQPAFRFNSYGNSSAAASSNSESSLSMQQTARIVAQIAFRQQVDDVSAYALLGAPDKESDQFRQVAAAYGDSAD